MGKEYNRWSGQWVGQAASSSAAADSTVLDAATASAATSDITAANYAQALNSISSSPVMTSSASSAGLLGSMSPTTMVLIGVAAVGALYFLTRK